MTTNNEHDTGTEPILHSIEQVSDGWLKKYTLSYLMPDNSLYSYEVVSRKGLEAFNRELKREDDGAGQTADAICIVPRTADGELVLIREFRYPLNSWCIAFPAGLIEEGEDMLTCIERELAEETGYGFHLVDGKPVYRALPQAGYSSTGMSEESVQVVYALVEKQRDAQPEPSEFIEPFTLPLSEIPQFLEQNTTPIGTRCQLVLDLYARGGDDGLL